MTFPILEQLKNVELQRKNLNKKIRKIRRRIKTIDYLVRFSKEFVHNEVLKKREKIGE